MVEFMHLLAGFDADLLEKFRQAIFTRFFNKMEMSV